MSTYIVSPATLAGATRAVIENTRFLTLASYQVVAAALYKLNRHAVAKRYNEEMDNRAFLPDGFEEQWEISLTLGEQMLADCLHDLWYQCSESLDPLYEDAYKEITLVKEAYEERGFYKHREG